MILSEHDYRTSTIARRLRMLVLKVQMLDPEPRLQVSLLLHWTGEWFLRGIKYGFIGGLLFGGLLMLLLARI